MRCPRCSQDAVPFAAVWIRSGFGRYSCRHCGAISTTSREPLLAVNTFTLGVAAVAVAFLLRSWLVFCVLLACAVALDAALDWRFRRLEALVDQEPPDQRGAADQADAPDEGRAGHENRGLHR